MGRQHRERNLPTREENIARLRAQGLSEEEIAELVTQADADLSRKAEAKQAATPEPAAPNNFASPSVLRIVTTLVIISFVTVCAYWYAFRVGFLSDDHLMLAFASVAPLDLGIFTPQAEKWLLFHRPLPLVLWQLMYQLWGLNPFPYHLLSVVFHTVNSLLLMCLINLISPRTRLTTLCAGLTFAVFPLNVETVVWLSCWFDLVALGFYCYALISLVMAWKQKSMRWYFLSLGAFQLAVWSKEAAFTLPALALIVGLFVQPRPRLKLLAASLAPYCILLSINLLQRFIVWGSFGGYSTASSDQLAPAFTKVVSTIMTLVAPLNRTLFPLSVVVIAALLTIGIISVGVIGRSQRKLLGFGVLWIGVTIIPVFSLLPVGQDLQNARLLYPVTVGYAIVVSVAVTNLLVSIAGHNMLLRFGLISGLLFAGVTAIQLQTQPWLVASRATETLLTHIQQALPPSRLGTILQIVNPPDNYHGAYIFRLGMDASMITRRGQLFIHWPNYHASAIPYQEINLDRDFYQIVLQSNEAQEEWKVTQIRGVTYPGTLPEFPRRHWIYAMNGDHFVENLAIQPLTERPIFHQWNFSDCNSRQQWYAANAVLTCEQGFGLVVTPSGDDPSISIPNQNISTDRWTQVEVSLQALAHTDQGRVQIFWGSKDEGFAEERSMAIELPSTPQLLNYQFFIPPQEKETQLTTLRIDPINQQLPVRIVAIRIRQDP